MRTREMDLCAGGNAVGKKQDNTRNGEKRDLSLRRCDFFALHRAAAFPKQIELEFK